MSVSKRVTSLVLIALAAGFVLLIFPAISGVLNAGQPDTASAQQTCSILDDPHSIPAPILINFDNLPDASVIGTQYQATFGVRFEDSPLNKALIYGQPSAQAHSDPNVAINDAVSPNTSEDDPMVIDFDSPKTHVGFYMGNGDTPGTVALITAYDIQGAIVCQVRQVPVASAHTNFIGFNDTLGSIVKLTILYDNTVLSESIDDLFFSPAPGVLPPRRPEPTWTPVPPPTATPGPAPTATPIIPMYAFLPPVEQVFTPILLKPDLSIHGIEVTQGIQCFDTSKGLASCSDNSLRVVNKKDSAARIYLKTGGIFSSLNNIPVRLYIRANNIWYSGNATGKATTAINQALSDSAEIYFNVNFSNDVVVDFYAIVDPNNTISETNEGNNRYPANGYITLTFRARDTLKIVGQRLRYHPSGYSGSQYAGGWAVNGGAADWFEQLLPLRNNGVNYSIASGYKNWTTSLGSGDGQHDLIKALNAQWILENVFAFLFSGAFTGADHVYGWAPNDGYSGGHADMPVYPHAGGYGIVGIGTDRPGTSTDNPGGGALIFGHELIHDYDVLHTDTVDSCGSSDSASDFPYSSSSIQEFGFNTITGKIYNPSSTHDVMSYCPAGGSKLGWIAPFTWEKMNTALDVASQIQAMSSRSAQVNTLQQSSAAESLVVNLTVFNPQYAPAVAASLHELYKVSTGVNFTPQLGDYAVELRDSKGSPLASQPFAVNFTSEYAAHTGPHPQDEPPFPPEPTTKVDLSFVIPWVDGTASVALVHQGSTVDEVTVSSNAPQVIISSPNSAESWLPGSQHTISWQGLDLDSDPLIYALFFSRDAGLSWELIEDGLTSEQYTLDTDDLAGGSDVRFRVVVTDGILTGVDETDHAITVPNHAPELTIMNPVAGAIYLQDSLVVLQGMAIDFEDGTLDDSLLSWSSDVQGGLGVGPSVPLITLQPGNHTISLTATDSYGISNSAQVSIFVGYPLYLPQIAK
jgi:hypothetical protein